MVNHSGHIYALETSTVDSTSMNSTILIEDSEREIDPDSSYDLDGSALERGSSAKRFSSNDVDNGLNEDGTRTDGDATVASSSLSEDVGCEPLFKVMFRDESVARYVEPHVAPRALFTGGRANSSLSSISCMLLFFNFIFYEVK